MAVYSSPKEMGPNVGCGDCLRIVQGWMFGDCFGQSEVEITHFKR